jgi:hypothetical protein
VRKLVFGAILLSLGGCAASPTDDTKVRCYHDAAKVETVVTDEAGTRTTIGREYYGCSQNGHIVTVIFEKQTDETK